MAHIHTLLVLGVFGLLMPAADTSGETRDESKFLVVDCLLPSQVRRLGSMTYAAARKAVKTSTTECESRGGEYVAYDRANQASTLKVWLPLAKEGDAEAQTYVGEAYEKGFGEEPDYGAAAVWYLRAAEQGYSRAAINLGNLFEQGLGLERDAEMAKVWYRRASGIADDASRKAPATPAKILIVEPQLDQRGITVSGKETDPGESVLVIGQIDSKVAIDRVVVNGEPLQLIGGSMFRGSVFPEDGLIDVEAIRVDGQSTRLTFSVDPQRPPQRTAVQQELGSSLPATAPKGRFHAVVIGNNDYLSLNDLATARQDAESVASVLREDYGFSVTVLFDADRYAVLSALNDLRTGFSTDDHLLIYYAGHGELDRINRRGHWLPVDAEADNPANWISNIAITDMLNVIPAKQLLVIADSCYSGMMSRSVLGVLGSVDVNRESLLEDMGQARSRTALTSGGVAPVLDSAGGGHSVFAAELLAALKGNRGAMTGLELYEAVAPRVQDASARVGFEQVPEYAPLQYAGHEAGDFILYKIQR